MASFYLYFSGTYKKHLIYKMEATEIYRVYTFQVCEHLIDDTETNLSGFAIISPLATKHTGTWGCVFVFKSYLPLKICIILSYNEWVL